MRSEKYKVFLIFRFLICVLKDLKSACAFFFLLTIIFYSIVFTIKAEENSVTESQKQTEPQIGTETKAITAEKTKNPFFIKSIKIQGSKTMPDETILGILQTKTGEDVSLKRISDDVKELFKLGQFSDIQVDSVGSEDGIAITFIMAECPKVKDIILEGNKEIADGKIKDVLTISPGYSLSGKLLHENKNKILALYQKKGYYLAQVESDAVVNTDGSANALFKINEGSKIKVEEIKITGNRMVSSREIRKQMKVKKGKRFDDTFFEGDQKTVVEYYKQKGFINAKIVESHIDFNNDKTGVIVNIGLDEGPQFRVGQIQAQIQPYENEKPLFTEKSVLKDFTLEEGDVFSEASFNEGIAMINKMYFDKGRVFMRIIDDRNYDPVQEVVDVNLRISEGGLAYIDSVPINWVSETSDEPHKTKEYIIRRELDRFGVKRDEMFSSQNIEDARRKILTLGPFIRRAQPQPRLSLEVNPEGNSQGVIVNFNIEESRQSGMFSIAGGYGSGNTGGGLFGAVDIWDDNILGRAWRIHVRGEIGTKERRTGQISLSTPWIFNIPISLDFSLYSKSRIMEYYPDEEDNTTSDRRYRNVGGSITIGRPLTRQIDLSIGLRNDNINYEQKFEPFKAAGIPWGNFKRNENIDYKLEFEPLSEEPGWEKIDQGKTRGIKFIADRDTRQFLTSMYDPNSGSYNTLSAEYSGLLGGDEFQKYTTDSSIFIPTWWKLVLVFHMQTGFLGGKKSELPQYERFALGGMDSVRGYPNYSIRPPGEYERYGGNKMAVLNVEYRFPITDMLRGLIFFDAGQVWGDNEWPWDKFKPRKSIGIGLRIDLMGALARLEYGYALDEAREGKGIERTSIQFDIGPAF